MILEQMGRAEGASSPVSYLLPSTMASQLRNIVPRFSNFGTETVLEASSLTVVLQMSTALDDLDTLPDICAFDALSYSLAC
jgi:hypothetical protein